ncbi:TPA: hypothetical protein HA371_06010 [Candidatus Woesearchaeota archaeon]|nr:hypothetical protein [Candidatus Woesearchaeota archaeon]
MSNNYDTSERREQHKRFMESVFQQSDEALSSDPLSMVGEGWWPPPREYLAKQEEPLTKN